MLNYQRIPIGLTSWAPRLQSPLARNEGSAVAAVAAMAKAALEDLRLSNIQF